MLTSFSYHVSESLRQIYFIVCLFFYLQGIKQHNPAAYVLNKTVPKHRLPAVAGTTATTKPDGLNPNTDTVTVCFSLYAFVWVCQVMLDLGEIFK